ncbi:MAG: hypothetical protein N2037_08110 [Acidimicrobiales bacterium]|nr:hypothetical protein [Acidimicrobiales bacterium]
MHIGGKAANFVVRGEDPSGAGQGVSVEMVLPGGGQETGVPELADAVVGGTLVDDTGVLIVVPVVVSFS